MILPRVKNKKSLWILGVFMVFCVVCYTLYKNGLAINVTSSMPKGIYWRDNSPILRGDLIAFCLPVKQQALGLKRHYLMKGSRCELSEPLIKKVIAVPGDSIVLTMDTIIVNGHNMAYTTHSQDSKKRPIPFYPRGVYLTNGYWVIGTSSPKSWDSRYFGSLTDNAILWKMKPIWILSEIISHKDTF
jgi:conjugative transfer signal peptidase TraF